MKWREKKIKLVLFKKKYTKAVSFFITTIMLFHSRSNKQDTV